MGNTLLCNNIFKPVRDITVSVLKLPNKKNQTFFSRCSIDSETSASELLENLTKTSPHYL